MDLSLAPHSDHVAERGPSVDRSKVAFVDVADAGAAGVDYGKADIHHSEPVDSGTVA